LLCFDDIYFDFLIRRELHVSIPFFSMGSMFRITFQKTQTCKSDRD